MNNKVLVGIIVAVLILGAVFFMMRSGSNDAGTNPSATSSPREMDMTEASPASDSATPEGTGSAAMTTAADGTKEITVSGSNFKFDVSTITVNEGDKVRVIFKVAQGFHDFVIDEFDVKTKQMAAGQSETVEFTANKAGTYDFYCSVGQHRQNGMEGKLIVQ